MCSWSFVEDDSDDLLLHFREWLKVGFGVVVAPPYRGVDEVWVDV